MEGKDAVKISLGIWSLSLSALANALHLFFTIILTREQIINGWGQGTSLEIGVLYPWLVEGIFGLPALILAVVYFCLFPKHPGHKAILVANIVLTSLLLIQVIMTNLFIFY